MILLSLAALATTGACSIGFVAVAYSPVAEDRRGEALLCVLATGFAIGLVILLAGADHNLPDCNRGTDGTTCAVTYQGDQP